MLSDAISEHLIFKNFRGGMPPDPPSKSMLHMLSVLRTLSNATYSTTAIYSFALS